MPDDRERFAARRGSTVPSSPSPSGTAAATTPTPATPAPTTSTPLAAIVIATNGITYAQQDLDFCHEPFVVTYTFQINGIPADTPIVVQLKGRGTPSVPQTYLATGGEAFGTSYSVLGGPGQWSATIETIAGAPPPFPSGTHESTSINC